MSGRFSPRGYNPGRDTGWGRRGGMVIPPPLEKRPALSERDMAPELRRQLARALWAAITDGQWSYPYPDEWHWASHLAYALTYPKITLERALRREFHVWDVAGIIPQLEAVAQRVPEVQQILTWMKEAK